MAPLPSVHAIGFIAMSLFAALTGRAPAQEPSGTRWFANGTAVADFRITVDDAVAHNGRSSLRIVADDQPDGFAGEAPRPTRPRGIDNLVALTHLTGYVRFFHPADSVLTTNWDEFVVRGMRVAHPPPTVSRRRFTPSSRRWHRRCASFAPVGRTPHAVREEFCSGSIVATECRRRVQKRDGNPHHGVGIRPTVPVAPTIRGVRAGRDDVLQRALEVVTSPVP